MPRISWKLGKVAGIDLFLHPTFLLLLAWGFFEGGLPYTLMIVAAFGCILLHELGHALSARAYGIATRDITLYPIGGVARLERMPKAAGPELVIALAGPLVNVAIAVVLALTLALAQPFYAPEHVPSVAAFAANLMMLNVFLAAFNLVPAFPMDGGRVFRAILAGPLGRHRATEIAVGLGRFIAVAFGCFALFTGAYMQVILAIFIYYVSGAELYQVRREEYEARERSSDGIWFAPPGVRWVNTGKGVWQAVPIHAEVRAPGPRPWY